MLFCPRYSSFVEGILLTGIDAWTSGLSILARSDLADWVIAIQYTDSKPVPPYVLFTIILLSFNDVDTSKSIEDIAADISFT
jgi:hypothetical protein